MKGLVNDAASLLRKMISVPSVSFEEQQVCALVSGWLEEKGVKNEILGNNIVSFNSFYDPKKPTLALCAHLDTVPAAPSYTRNPFDAGDDPDIIYGLGSNDDGGSVVCMIAAMRHYYEADLPFNLMLALTCEEERSGQGGAAMLFASDGPLAGRLPSWVIVGEPTSLDAATSERGLLVLDGEASGVSGHAARNEGLNALYRAIEDINALRAYKFDRHSSLMGDVKLNVTQINAGTAHNVIPDKCTFVVDIRPTEQYTNPEILSLLQAQCKYSTLKARKLTNMSSASHTESLLLDTLQEMGIATFSSPTTSDWMKLGGTDAVKMGPGDSSRSHKADEYIKMKEIEAGVNRYIEFIAKFSGLYSAHTK